LIDVEGPGQSTVKRFTKKLIDLTAGKVLAYYNRPKVLFPHQERGICGSIKIGEGSVMQERVRIDCTGDVEIGKHCRIIRGVHIFTHSHAYLKGLEPDVTAKHDIVTSGIRIGDNVYIGLEALVLPQCNSIGDNAIIGARAVLTRDVPAGEIWAGNPARKVGERSDEGVQLED
jgi:acetyltransferase-like isoleucine patch superfamily enzyme